MASFASATVSKYEGYDLEEWMKHFNLNPIASILKEVGARELIDLIDIYSDEDLLREVTEHHTCNKIMQKRFLKAAYLTSLFDGVSSSFIVNSASVMSISATTARKSSATTADDTELRALMEKAKKAESELKRVEESKAKKDAKKKELEEMIKKFEDATVATTMDRYKAETEMRSLSKKTFLVKKRKDLIKKLEKDLEETASVDIAFLLDCTGSMARYIDGVKTQIQMLSTSLKESYPLLTMRLAFIGYRDHCDGEKRLAVLRFTQDIDAFKSFVGAQAATGGGDGPEDIFGALNVATDLDWQSATRFLYLVGDAPCHGSIYHDMWDDYPDGDKFGLKIENLLPALAEKNVKCHFGRITKCTDKMIRIFNEVMGGKSFGGQFFDTLEMTNTSKIVESVSASVATTRSATLSYSASTDKFGSKIDLSKIPVSSTPPSWGSLKTESIVLYSIKIPLSVDSLLAGSDADLIDNASFNVVHQKVAEIPFGKGASRLAYWVQQTKDGRTEQLVHKVMVKSKPSELTRAVYEGLLANQSVAIYFSREFSRYCPSTYPAIEYIPVHLLQYHERSPDYPYATQEAVLSGAWEKFNNNHGWINDNPVRTTGTDHSVIQAFSHWTYHFSRGIMLLVDCQGVYDAAAKRFRLTDPAIHCTDVTRLSATNLGKKGMKLFFATHKCNDCCRALELPSSTEIH